MLWCPLATAARLGAALDACLLSCRCVHLQPCRRAGGQQHHGWHFGHPRVPDPSPPSSPLPPRPRSILFTDLVGLGNWWEAGAKVESSFDLKTLIIVEVRQGRRRCTACWAGSGTPDQPPPGLELCAEVGAGADACTHVALHLPCVPACRW